MLYLQKCFKTLFNSTSNRQEGTLAFFKNRLKKVNVTGKVKGKFQSHSDFLKLITKGMVKEQAMELFQMTDEDDSPGILPENIINLSKSTKEQIMYQVCTMLIENFHYLSEVEVGPHEDTGDQLYNYCTNLCSWGLHLLEMDDTAKEGDISRIIPNLKKNYALLL